MKHAFPARVWRVAVNVAMMLLLLVAGMQVGAAQVCVVVRVFEVPHRTLTGLVSAPAAMCGDAIHERLLGLAAEGGAEIIDTQVLTVRARRRTYVESVVEFVYPVEYNPPGGRIPPPDRGPRPQLFQAFEARNLGSSLELMVDDVSNGVTRLVYSWSDTRIGQMVPWMRYRDGYGDGTVRMPVFDMQVAYGSLLLADGKYELARILNPATAALPPVEVRRVVFVGAYVLDAGVR